MAGGQRFPPARRVVPRERATRSIRAVSTAVTAENPPACDRRSASLRIRAHRQEWVLQLMASAAPRVAAMDARSVVAHVSLPRLPDAPRDRRLRSRRFCLSAPDRWGGPRQAGNKL